MAGKGGEIGVVVGTIADDDDDNDGDVVVAPSESTTSV